MDTNLNKIAKDLYGKIETRFPDIKIGDENAEVLSRKGDIPRARFFEFEYEDRGVKLGNVTITLDREDGVVVQISGSLAEKKHPGVFKFIRGLRSFAKDRLLNFDIQNINKDQLDKRDYEFQAKPKEEFTMMESKMYGTAKISYQDLGEARLVVKHSQPVNTDLAAGRTMHIESIYVENADGERFKYPFKHLAGARALAEHLKHGGIPYDSIGKHITSLSEELAQLRKFKGYVGRNEALSEAMGDITSKVMERIDSVKKEIQQLSRTSYYEAFVESFEDHEEKMIPEAVMDDWIDRLTIRTFNEELRTAFPYIFRLIDESEIPVKELDPSDLLDEDATGPVNANAQCRVCHTPYGKHFRFNPEGDVNGTITSTTIRGLCGRVPQDFPDLHTVSESGARQAAIAIAKKKSGKYDKEGNRIHESPEDQFESFIENIVTEDETTQQGVNTLFSTIPEIRSQAVKNLKDKISQGLKPGTDGVNAALTLKGIIDSDKFTENYLKGLSDNDNIVTVLKQYVKDVANNDPKAVTSGKNPGAQDAARELLASKELDNMSSDASTPPDIGAEPAAPAPGGETPPAPDMGAETPPAPDMGAETPPPAPGGETPPAPVAESGLQAYLGNKKYGKDGMDQLRQAGRDHVGSDKIAKLKAKLIKARESGAELHDKVDFGHKEMTLHDCMKQFKINPMECGFESPTMSSSVSDGSKSPGEMEIESSISGFWNKDAPMHEGNFTIGPTRVITKILKSYNNGEYRHAKPHDVKKVIARVKQMDPPSSVKGIEHKPNAHPTNMPYSVAESDELARIKTLMQKISES
jgi:hypothetical protein